jgi:hypothetical protein
MFCSVMSPLVVVATVDPPLLARRGWEVSGMGEAFFVVVG